ncbi:nucleotidyltransferase domain-containing protein [Anoxynatronum sibiricum]|uniref:Nucleotidyltransferase domain-containing protein n=1 Tax=Anoxynatronum sibiricum TaxID=210623 RepID=A0ABU9VU84_9CLOT
MPYGLDEQVIRQMRRLFQKEGAVCRVILYGSRAMGTFHQGSDIDLTIEGPLLDFDLLLRLKVEMEELNLPYRVDLSIWDHLQHEALKEHIRRVGIVIYEKGDKMDKYKDEDDYENENEGKNKEEHEIKNQSHTWKSERKI